MDLPFCLGKTSWLAGCDPISDVRNVAEDH